MKKIYILLLLFFFTANTAFSKILSVNDEFLTFYTDKNEITVNSSEKLILKFNVALKDHIKINSAEPKEEYLIPTKLSIVHPSIKIVQYNYPPPEYIKLIHSSEKLSVYKGNIEINAEIIFADILSEKFVDLPVSLSYQACDENNCYAPAEQFLKLKIKFVQPVKTEIQEEAAVQIIQTAVKESEEQRLESARIEETANAENIIQEQRADTVSYKLIMTYLFFALLGGLILNVMPCVLPVISIKLMGLIKYSTLDRRAIIRNSLFYVSGIFTTFFIIALIIIFFKKTGAAVGWGFQFQNPRFLIFLISIIFCFALSLSGVYIFNIALPAFISKKSSFMNMYVKSYFEGIFATLLATPCAAPFLGTALGFAFTQKANVIILIFLFIAAGMALPYLLISLFPAFIKFLPKPGNWMETFKQLLAFPLYAVVLWLLIVLNNIAGSDIVFNLLIFLTVLAFICWLTGKFQNITASKIRMIFRISIIIFIFVVYKILFSDIKLFNNVSENIYKGSVIKYTGETVEKYRADNIPVFIEFTADWCLTCQTNKKLVIESNEIRKLFEEKNIAHIRADWTRGDKKITEALNSYGRAGVPLYVYYAAGIDTPVILPELLTRKIIIQKLTEN